MRRTADDAVILRHGYSPAAQWFTNLSFSFRGVDAVDVRFALQDWGSNFAGDVPVVTFVDKVHRPFPVVDASAPAPPTAQGHEQVPITGDRILYGAFWGEIQGSYSFCVKDGGATYACIANPADDGAPGFEWYETTVEGTSLVVTGSAASRGPGFLFGELYELQDEVVTLPAA
jgi:hypothetical protein